MTITIINQTLSDGSKVHNIELSSGNGKIIIAPAKSQASAIECAYRLAEVLERHTLAVIEPIQEREE